MYGLTKSTGSSPSLKLFTQELQDAKLTNKPKQAHNRSLFIGILALYNRQAP